MSVAAQVLSDTSTYGVPLNSRIMFTFLQACWGASFTREQVARVFAEVAAMRAHRQPDHSVFAALLTFARRHLPEAATDVWTALQEVSPTFQHAFCKMSCGSMLTLYGSSACLRLIVVPM